MTFATTSIYPPSLNDGHHIFVFGSNLAGRHGKGAALDAQRHWGAKQGMGAGLTGQAYALPTKDKALKPLTLREVMYHVGAFLYVARLRTDMTFLVTQVGCGLAGYDDAQIAPMFEHAPVNCMLPLAWRGLL